MPDNASTKAADYATTHGFKILRVGAGMRAQAFATLQELEKELAGIVESAGEKPTLNDAKYKAMQNDAQATISDAYKLISKNHGKALDELAGIEWQASNKMINRAVGVDLVSGNIPPKLLEAIAKAPVVLGHSSADWWNGQSADLRQKFQGEMAKGTLLGETTPQLLKRLRGAGVFETPEAGSPPNLIKKAKRDAEALILTSSASIANHARLESFKAKSDLIKGIEWVSTLDSRTTLICIGLDGKQWRFPDMQPIGHDKAYPGSTAHWRCRSTIISVLYSWAELSGKKLPTLDNATLQERVDSILEKSGMSEEQRSAARVNTRASMDGQTSKNHTYETWAKKKGSAFIEQVLGPGRASLYETGKMSFSDLTDQNNRPITLKQLAASVATGKPPPETLGVDFLPRPAVSAINAAQEAARVAAQEAAQAAKDAEKAIKEAKDAADKARIEAEIAKRSAEAAQAEIDRLNSKIRRDAMEGEGLTEDQSKIAALASRYAEGSMGSNLTKEEKLAWMNLSGERKAFFDERVKSIREIAEAEAKITANEYILQAQGLPIPERKAPVSSHLTTDNDDLRPHLKHALDSIDRVIDDGGLPDFVLKSLKAGASDYGAYTSSGYETKGIEVNTDADKVGIASFAAVHEIGHFLDHKLVGAVGTWGHEGRFGEKWRAAVQKTEAYKAIQKNAKASLPPPNKKMAVYLAKEQEVFARAFAQYIAVKTNDPLLMRGLRKDRGASTSKYWSDAEFKTLIPVLDELFAEASARQIAAAAQ